MTKNSLAADAPVHVSKVGLKALNADALGDYYQATLGLAELKRSPERIVLGVGADGKELLEIERAPSLKPEDPRSAGLFHTAFLLPERADLARWVGYAARNHVRIDGASDHLVSEALYLTDPEGNGIEIYADRAPETWPRAGGSVDMATLPLDIAGLSASLQAKDTGWQGAPAGTIVGHVHLRVGDAAEAERWWNEEMGFETMARYGGAAVFLATGGYHHHIGANSWRSAGAGRRDTDRAGLAWVELALNEVEKEKMKQDPWGTEIRLASG